MRANEPGPGEVANCSFEYSAFHFPRGKFCVPMLVVTDAEVPTGTELVAHYGPMVQHRNYDTANSVASRPPVAPRRKTEISTEPLLRDVLRAQQFHAKIEREAARRRENALATEIDALKRKPDDALQSAHDALKRKVAASRQKRDAILTILRDDNDE